MLNKLIFVDVDGVLLDWTGQLPFFLHDKGLSTDHVLQFFESEPCSPFPPNGLFPDSENPLELLYEFIDSKYMRYLSPYPDAVEVVNRLSKQGFKFIAITAMSDNETTIKNRKFNLDAVFPNVFNHIEHVGIGESKETAFKRLATEYGTPVIYVDDFSKHIDEWKQSGVDGVGLLMHRNDDYQKHIGVYDWHGVESYLK